MIMNRIKNKIKSKNKNEMKEADIKKVRKKIL